MLFVTTLNHSVLREHTHRAANWRILARCVPCEVGERVYGDVMAVPVGHELPAVAQDILHGSNYLDFERHMTLPELIELLRSYEEEVLEERPVTW